jgi:hypothetical protein
MGGNMPVTPSTESVLSPKYSIPLFLALIVVGLAGKLLQIPNLSEH